MAEQKGQVAFIGLGVMGYPMAGHLVKQGYSVSVYNRTGSKAESWCSEYAELAAAQNLKLQAFKTPADAAKGADAVFVCVGNDDDVRQVTMDEQGVLSGMDAGTLLVDHTTASQGLALELNAACAQRGLGFLDAPVSGGQAGAENGALTVMVGGSDDDFARAGDYFEAYAKKYALMGAAGAGQLTKMVNQICIAGVLQGLSEGVHFAQQAGLDVGKVVDVIAQGAAQSWQMNNRASTMAEDEYEFGFAVDWMRKDLSIALATGRSLDARLPMTALVDQFYADVQQMGGGRWDTSSLLRRLTVKN
ncbi:MAG: NAD(P)-dependent oxidoreductase [Gammaproteobacteria bacterium]|jgi:3-hydroxyisobutyrate dehydrogenase-like beta-hydroxyacid dehydrogenase|nr:NAD(P)-dependent oxidoreductase [Gammaproteobacteria bacterium]MBT3695425.1 NAD(P)-dependent oxidoreductase [Gammaproteobacteria bacterium]MBT5681522.1 NAD(P)-dependent oxidoreductase [Gammaproteobacteria bacterium]MBT6026006.1 NAD(P)-dependent oxidoreductase [Gammaproteobacteria bacterium]MBT6556868.1 NAD(P)-dependent oxidoreductase [Gammaproteobacteria bacterium]